MKQPQTMRGLGLAAALPELVILGAARDVKQRAFHSFWLNNPPGAAAIPILGEVARQAPGMSLGVGVIPLSHFGPDQIVRQLQQTELPIETFYLGLGSGSGSGGVDRVRAGVEEIRRQMRCQIVVAALGPKMCRLAGGAADGVLLNWLTPEWAERSIVWVREGADAAGKPVPRLMTYVRVALGSGAIEKLRVEGGHYESIPHYAAHFERMGVDAVGTSVTGESREEIARGLERWNGVVDEVVCRAITENDKPAELSLLIEACRP